MQRYTPLFFIAFILSVAALAVNLYMPGYADNQAEKIRKEITVYTTIPVENAVVLAENYEKSNKVKLNFIFLTQEELLRKLQAGKADGRVDAALTDKETLIKAAAFDAFAAYTSEQTDIVADRFKSKDGDWVGVWYDPIVFCANRDYLQSLSVIPSSWRLLAELKDCRLGITDFLAASASSNLLYTLIAEYDEERAFALMRQLHPKVVQYAKYLSTPVRMAGMGEVDISIAVQSESLRYINDGFPIALLYPSEGTAYMLTGVGILKNTKNKAEVVEWMQWLLSDEAQICLQKNKFYFVPTNQMTIAHKFFNVKNLHLFEHYSDLTMEQKEAVIDRWIKNIRLN